MEMVKKSILLLFVAVAMLSCEAEFADGVFEDEMESISQQFYFLDADLQFEGEDSTRVIQHFVDLDPDTPAGINETLVSRSNDIVEVYSVFHHSSTMLDEGPVTEVQLEQFQDEYGFTYGSVSYEGLGFCFFLPADSQSPGTNFALVRLDSMLQAGNILDLGRLPGQVEVGYYKSAPGFIDDDYRGFVSNSMSNDGGTFKVEEASPAVDVDGRAGYQLRVSFRCRLFKQYINSPTAELEGNAVIFVPEL